MFVSFSGERYIQDCCAELVLEVKGRQKSRKAGETADEERRRKQEARQSTITNAKVYVIKHPEDFGMERVGDADPDSEAASEVLP